jgi:hypothetical protein
MAHCIQHINTRPFQHTSMSNTWDSGKYAMKYAIHIISSEFSTLNLGAQICSWECAIDLMWTSTALLHFIHWWDRVYQHQFSVSVLCCCAVGKYVIRPYTLHLTETTRQMSHTIIFLQNERMFLCRHNYICYLQHDGAPHISVDPLLVFHAWRLH